MKAGEVVLVVDDDLDIQENLDQFLRYEGYVPEKALNGQEALDLLNGGLRPAVILLDLMMPVMTGYELVGKLRGAPGSPFMGIPIIILSAASDAQAVARKWRVGCVRKPFDLDRLSEALRKA